jgi:hypothetical protein
MPSFICADCGHIGEPDVTQETEKHEFWGSPVYRTLDVECCADCGSENIDIAYVCRDCHEREPLDGFDGCAQCELAFAEADGDTDTASAIRQSMRDLDATIRDIVMTQAVRHG